MALPLTSQDRRLINDLGLVRRDPITGALVDGAGNGLQTSTYGLRTVLFGHSFIDNEAGGDPDITNDSGDNLLVTGTVQWANWLIGKPLQVVKEFGYGSRRIMDMMPRYAGEVAPLRPQVLIVSIGHNDLKGLYAGGSDQAPADVRQRQLPYLVSLLRAWLSRDVSPSTRVYLLAETPSGKDATGAVSANNHKNLAVRYVQFNEAMRRLATEYGNVVYVPTDRATTDPTSLTMLNQTKHFYDTVHPGIIGSYARGKVLAAHLQRTLPVHCDNLPTTAADSISNTWITVNTASEIVFNGASATFVITNTTGQDWLLIEVGDWVTMQIVSAITGEIPLCGRFLVTAADAASVTVATTGVGTIAAGRVVKISNSRQLFINPLFLTMTGGQQAPSGVVGTIAYGGAGGGLLGATQMPLGATIKALPAQYTVTVNYAAHTQRDGSAGFGNWLVLDVVVSGASGATQFYIDFYMSGKTETTGYDVERKLAFGQAMKQCCEVRQENATGGYQGVQTQIFVQVQNTGGSSNQVYWKTSDIYRNVAATPVDADNPWPADDITFTSETPEMIVTDNKDTREISFARGRVFCNFFGDGTVRLKIGRMGLYVVDYPIEEAHIALK